MKQNKSNSSFKKIKNTFEKSKVAQNKSSQEKTRIKTNLLLVILLEHRTKDHPMLHCPKRHSPIPEVNFNSAEPA